MALLLFPSFCSCQTWIFLFFAAGEWCPGGSWPPSHIQLITNVPSDFRSQSTWAALTPKAVTPGRKDELSGAPGAAPTTCAVGPSVPLWGCKESSRYLVKAPRSLSGPQRQHVLLHSCCRREQGKALDEAPPWHALDKTEGTTGLQWANKYHPQLEQTILISERSIEPIKIISWTCSSDIIHLRTGRWSPRSVSCLQGEGFEFITFGMEMFSPTSLLQLAGAGQGWG